MKLLRLTLATALPALLYAAYLLQDTLEMKIVTIGYEQLFILAAATGVYFVLSAFERTAKFKTLPAALAAVALTDIALYNLLVKGYSAVYLTYLPVRSFLAAVLLLLAASFIEFTTHPLRQSVISASALVLAGFIAFLLLSEIGFQNLAIPAFAIFAVLAATSFATAFENEAAEILRSQRLFLLVLIFAVVIYALLIKPYVGERVGLANIVEWLIVCAAAVKLSHDFRSRLVISEDEVVSAHSMVDKFIKDKLSGELDEAAKLFIEKGIKTNFIVALVAYLTESGVESERISKLLVPLVDYRDSAIPRIAFPWEREIIKRRNRERRAKLVEKLRRAAEREI